MNDFLAFQLWDFSHEIAMFGTKILALLHNMNVTGCET